MQDRDDPKARPTLRTIAEMTGLSLSTVSLSLRGGASLKQETRDRVAAAARQIGYVPDRAGVRLRTGKTNVITLVLHGGDDSIDFARQMIQGIGRALAGTQYHLNVTPEFGADGDVSAVRYILDSRAADGVIITHTTPDDPRVAALAAADFPFVSHGRTAFAAPHPFHDFHSEEFARQALERLADKGCKRVMLFIGNRLITNYANIVTAFRAAATRRGVIAEVLEVGEARSTPDEVRALGAELAQRPDRPDGIITDNEIRTIALLAGMQAAGLNPGQGVELVYKQTSGILPTFYPHLDSIEEDVTASGEELTRLLLQRIHGEAAGTLQTLAEPVLHWRSSGPA
ncbi:LacI family transcriptional regulator [Devosia sp. XJ19-1]|uniref:LacI family transcriptional regulator n=1 Tax=Devosia ureilytica TaxID=2952754 RepID=A0A9Q4ALW1_9HYPH|nr:LacI family transcriptional regulator [Devosia ureilytica]MCP8883315.1 LacI family transcriptional regulator [Devosia ureilytica]MCP8886317.1 LacI family transcriptional regulator [Devosia ureilytica]